MEISSHYIKLSGKAELPKPLDMGNNYDVSLSGSVTRVAEHDNEDGTAVREYNFKAIRVEVLTPTGESIKAKDTRSNSQLLRSLLWKKWVNAASNIPFEDYYQKFTYGVMRDVDELLDRYVA